LRAAAQAGRIRHAASGLHGNRTSSIDWRTPPRIAGVFRAGEKEKQVAGATEEEVYGVFDLPYIVPELREMQGG
jgi:hypothetical protein